MANNREAAKKEAEMGSVQETQETLQQKAKRLADLLAVNIAYNVDDPEHKLHLQNLHEQLGQMTKPDIIDRPRVVELMARVEQELVRLTDKNDAEDMGSEVSNDEIERLMKNEIELPDYMSAEGPESALHVVDDDYLGYGEILPPVANELSRRMDRLRLIMNRLKNIPESVQKLRGEVIQGKQGNTLKRFFKRAFGIKDANEEIERKEKERKEKEMTDLKKEEEVFLSNIEIIKGGEDAQSIKRFVKKGEEGSERFEEGLSQFKKDLQQLIDESTSEEMELVKKLLQKQRQEAVEEKKIENVANQSREGQRYLEIQKILIKLKMSQEFIRDKDYPERAEEIRQQISALDNEAKDLVVQANQNKANTAPKVMESFKKLADVRAPIVFLIGAINELRFNREAAKQVLKDANKEIFSDLNLEEFLDEAAVFKMKKAA